jgi:hypothetical protein
LIGRSGKKSRHARLSAGHLLRCHTRKWMAGTTSPAMTQQPEGGSALDYPPRPPPVSLAPIACNVTCCAGAVRNL